MYGINYQLTVYMLVVLMLGAICGSRLLARSTDLPVLRTGLLHTQLPCSITNDIIARLLCQFSCTPALAQEWAVWSETT